MQITNKWLREKEVCKEGIVKWLREKEVCRESIVWFEKQNYKSVEGIRVVKDLIKQDHLKWANWLIVRIMNYKQYVCYGIFVVEQLGCVFRKKYPRNKILINIIKALKKYIQNPTNKNRKVAADAVIVAANTNLASTAIIYINAAVATFDNNTYDITYIVDAIDATINIVKYDAYICDAAATVAIATADAKKMRLRTLNYGLDLLVDG